MNRAFVRELIRSRTRRTVLAGVVIFTVGFAVWPGCAFAPLPSKRAPIGARTSAQFKFKKSEHPTRDEVVAQLGPPDEYVADLRVACYRVNDVTRRKVFLCLFVIPIDVQESKAQDIGLIEFDEYDRVLRADIKTKYSYVRLKDAARDWVNKQEK